MPFINTMYNVRSGVATKYIPRFINSSKSKLLCSIPSLSLGLLSGLRSGNTGSNSLNRVGNDRSHSGEKKDFLDVRAVGEEHDKTVDTKTPATCRWETVLETTQRLATIQIWTKRWKTYASRKVSSTPWASSSPCSFCLTCSMNLSL